MRDIQQLQCSIGTNVENGKMINFNA